MSEREQSGTGATKVTEGFIEHYKNSDSSSEYDLERLQGFVRRNEDSFLTLHLESVAKLKQRGLLGDSFDNAGKR